MKRALIATDFSGEAEAARRRAAAIATECPLEGSIAHVLPSSLPVDLHLQSSLQAQKALDLVAGEMRGRGLSFDALLLSGDIAGELTRAARTFDMVIAGARGEDLLLDFGTGRTSARLVRDAQRPVLIVKRPSEQPYRRVVAAVDFSEPSFLAAQLGMQLSPRAEFNLVHAFEVEFESSLRRAGATNDAIEPYRRQARENANAAIAAFAARLGLSPAQVSISAVLGYAPRVILDYAERHNAQLIVIGKHAPGAVERLILGSVALRVLEAAKCDVLVVPE